MMMRKKSRASKPRSMKLVLASAVLILGVSTVIAQNQPDLLKSGFENPPEGASNMLSRAEQGHHPATSGCRT